MKYELIKIKIIYGLGYFCGLLSGILVSLITAIILFPIVYIKYFLGYGKKPVLKRRRSRLVVIKGNKLEII